MYLVCIKKLESLETAVDTQCFDGPGRVATAYYYLSLYVIGLPEEVYKHRLYVSWTIVTRGVY